MATQTQLDAGHSSAKAPEAAASSSSSSRLHRFAFGTSCATLFLLLAGSLVVGNKASLSVPDWPLAFGQLVPPLEGGVFYEYGHRVIAGTVAVLAVILAIWITRSDSRRWLHRLGWAAVGAVVLQAALGGITVLYELPAPISITHACLAQIFFCLTLWMSLGTSRWWAGSAAPIQESSGLPYRTICAATTAALFLQLITGASVRHKVLGVSFHVLSAILVVVMVGWLVRRTLFHISENPPLQLLAICMGLMLAVQLALGIASYALRHATVSIVDPVQAVVWTTSLHLVTGALLLGTSFVITLLAFHRAVPASSPARSLDRARRSMA